MLALGVGLLIGIVVGLLGAGGGILSVPALMYLLDQTPYSAALGSLIGVALTSLGSLIVHARAHNVRGRAALLFGSLSIAGAVAGARVSLLLDDELLARVFAIFLIVVGVGFVVRTVTMGGDREGPVEAMTRRDLVVLCAAATATGLLTGVFGVGGGFMIVPVLVFVMKVPMRQAVGTSLLVMVVTSAAGILGRAPFHGDIDVPLLALFVTGSIAGGLCGSVVSKRIPPRVLTGNFALLVLVVGTYSATISWG